MTDKTLSLIGTLFLSILIAASYFPLNSRLNQPDFLAWGFGAAFVGMLPVALTAFAAVFGLLGFYFINERFGNGNH